MSRGRKTAAQLLVLSVTLVALVAAFPATAQDLAGCPTAWAQVPAGQNTEKDDNADGFVCAKSPGGGQRTLIRDNDLGYKA